MPDDAKLKSFPDLSNKLAAPTRKSVFQREKAEAEAKRLREEAETAAVYEDFVKSFDDEERDNRAGLGGRFGGGRLSDSAGASLPGGPPKRHFVPSAPRGSGPGSLGPAPPAPSRKRALDGTKRDERQKDKGIFAFDDSVHSGPIDAATAFQTLDDKDEAADEVNAAERAAPKPTLQLSSLPPGTSPAVIKSLLPSNLTVDGVRIVHPAGPGTSGNLERRSMSAIVTLAKDTPASDIDTAVNSLQNRYLGWGFYLSLSRHLSSAALGALGSSNSGIGPASSSLPFGARPTAQGPGPSLSRQPPPSSIHGRGFAPPASYAISVPGQYGRGAAPLQVAVQPPSDINQLKLIHKALEMLITHGPEFEALLMSRTDVQRDERWAWLWDPRSSGGVWYRWRLWEVLTNAKKGNARKSQYNVFTHQIFEGGAGWLEPEEDLAFEYTTKFDELISDEAYDSSDEDDSGDEGNRRRRKQQNEGAASDEQMYLNPLQKAKFTHLLARLPTTTGTLRKGDVARVTAFAISHAGRGTSEVVDMVVSNIEHPFAWSGANPDRKQDEQTNGHGQNHDDNKDTRDQEDVSPSKLIGLYLISDILSSSSTSGVRHAWRYRQLFETALKERRIFMHLGRLEKNLQWGRLRAEKWRRSVNAVLSLWEGWCVFPQAAQDHFVDVFMNPPATMAEKAAVALEETAAGNANAAARSRWKSLDAKAGSEEATAAVAMVVEQSDEMDLDVDGEPMQEDLDGQPMEDLDGEPMDDDEDVDGVLMEDEGAGKDSTSPDAVTGDITAQEQPVLSSTAEPSITAAQARRRRPKAEDMFADSDED